MSLNTHVSIYFILLIDASSVSEVHGASVGTLMEPAVTIHGNCETRVVSQVLRLLDGLQMGKQVFNSHDVYKFKINE